MFWGISRNEINGTIPSWTFSYNLHKYYLKSFRSWNFKDGGSLKASFLAKNQHGTKEKSLKKILRVMTVCQKLGVILESKVVQKLSLEKKVFNK